MTTDSTPAAGREVVGGSPGSPLERDVARERVRGALFGTATAVTIDRFTVIERIGEGGMSTVYAGYDPRLDRKIALKVLRGDHDSGTEASARQGRLLREARAMARLSHPNVGAVHDVGVLEAGDGPPQVWIAMEYIDGEDLRQWCERARPSAAEIIDAYVQAGRGLAAAHAAGLVHRDFKPDNAMRDTAGRVRVLDFGLARTHDDVIPQGRAAAVVRDDALSRMSAESLTRTGALVGTPAYLAPEQIEGGTADARSDQFAFCVALHEALWGVRPFPGETMAALFDAVLTGRVTVPPRRADVPSRVRAAVLRGLARDPAQRWPDLDALLAVLARGSSRRRLAVFGGVATVAIVAAITLRGADACAGADRAVGEQWSPAVREQVHTAVVADGRGFTGDLSTRVVGALEAYDAELRAAYHDACVATHEAGVQSTELLDRETACLDARGAGFRAVTALLVEADPQVIDRALETVAGLAPVSPCLDRAALLAITAPTDPALAQPVAAIAAQLAEAGANRRAGRFANARAQAEQAVAAAEALGDRPTRAEAAHELGLVLDELGDDAAACEHLATAHFLADASGQHTLAADSAGGVISCLPVGEDTRPELELWRRNGQAAIDRLADGELAQAALDARYGFALYLAERIPDAIALFESALEVRRRRLSADDAQTWSLELELATALLRQQRVEEGVTLAEAAAARAARAMGDDHPQMAAVLSNLANVHMGAGNMAEAETIGRRALAVAEAARGRDHPIAIAILLNLSSAVYMQERWDEAAALMRESLDRYERRGQADSLDWARAAHNYATALFELDRHDEALAMAERSGAWYAAQLGDSDGAAIDSHQLIGNIQLERGRLDEAERHFRLALQLAREGTIDDRHEQLLSNLGNFLRRADRPDEAVTIYEELQAILRARAATPWELAQTEYDLARSLWNAGEQARARALAEAALATLRSTARAAEIDGRYRRDASPEKLEAWLATHVLEGSR